MPHTCATFPLHCLAPGAHAPVHIPSEQTFGHSDAVVQRPSLLQSCASLSLHCVLPGLHSPLHMPSWHKNGHACPAIQTPFIPQMRISVSLQEGSPGLHSPAIPLFPPPSAPAAAPVRFRGADAPPVVATAAFPGGGPPKPATTVPIVLPLKLAPGDVPVDPDAPAPNPAIDELLIPGPPLTGVPVAPEPTGTESCEPDCGSAALGLRRMHFPLSTVLPFGQPASQLASSAKEHSSIIEKPVDCSMFESRANGAESRAGALLGFGQTYLRLRVPAL